MPDPQLAALLEQALGLSDEDDARWQIVAALHRRATPEVFEASAALCASEDAAARRLGADVLGQLGVELRPFGERALPILVGLLADPDDAVASAAGVALGHHRDPRALHPLVARADHPSAAVRLGVVHGLLGLDDDRAITPLVRLSGDIDASVRDWATFGLGTMLERDTPEIRDALAARLADPDPDARGEALVGLARRGDPRAIEPLRQLLAAGVRDPLVIEAAELAGLG